MEVEPGVRSLGCQERWGRDYSRSAWTLVKAYRLDPGST